MMDPVAGEEIQGKSRDINGHFIRLIKYLM